MAEPEMGRGKHPSLIFPPRARFAAYRGKAQFKPNGLKKHA
jgi:hypothetical protein